jgi:hypothetical protein
MSTRIPFDQLTKNQRATILDDLLKHPFVVVAATEGRISAPSAANEVFDMVRLGVLQLGLDRDGHLLSGQHEQIAVSAYNLDEIAPGVAAVIVHGAE